MLLNAGNPAAVYIRNLLPGTASVEGLALRFRKGENDQGSSHGKDRNGREAGRKSISPNEISYERGSYCRHTPADVVTKALGRAACTGGEYLGEYSAEARIKACAEKADQWAEHYNGL